jgi:hypothetical protein
MICSSEFLAGHGSNRFSFANKEPLRIGGIKAARVMKTGIPAFRRGPFEGEREIGLRHVAHKEIVAHGASPHLRFAAATSPSVT